MSKEFDFEIATNNRKTPCMIVMTNNGESEIFYGRLSELQAEILLHIKDGQGEGLILPSFTRAWEKAGKPRKSTMAMRITVDRLAGSLNTLGNVVSISSIKNETSQRRQTDRYYSLSEGVRVVVLKSLPH